MEETKICSKCHKRKKTIDFSKNKGYKDGYRTWCKECVREYSKKYRQHNAEYFKKYYKNHYQENKEKILLRQKNYYQNNKEKVNKRNESWRNKHKNELKEYRKSHRRQSNIWQKEKLLTDINFKLGKNLRKRIWKALKGINKAKKTIKLLGCTIPELKQHLEKEFTKGMSWNNYGYYGWHIDHIKPCASFDLSKPKEQQKCFNYTNLRPLWRRENQSRGWK